MKCGVLGRNRTCGLLDRNQTLYPLSYEDIGLENPGIRHRIPSPDIMPQTDRLCKRRKKKRKESRVVSETAIWYHSASNDF